MRLIEGRSFYKEPWYNNYRCMKSRCYRPKDPSYKYYGGRGIKVCDEWLNIENFEKWVKEHPYFGGATLDRINVDGDYEPSNCRWATAKEQMNNTRRNTVVQHDGKQMSLAQWADYLGMNYSSFMSRWSRGWTMDRIASTPTRHYRKVV